MKKRWDNVRERKLRRFDLFWRKWKSNEGHRNVMASILVNRAGRLGRGGWWAFYEQQIIYDIGHYCCLSFGRGGTDK